jgi:hypothetical protein
MPNENRQDYVEVYEKDSVGAGNLFRWKYVDGNNGQTQANDANQGYADRDECIGAAIKVCGLFYESDIAAANEELWEEQEGRRAWRFYVDR